MITIRYALSSLTGKQEVCTIMPEHRSEIDGKLIVEGTPDCDLLAMHDFSWDREFGLIPACLASPDSPKLVEQAKDKTCAKIGHRLRKREESDHERLTRQATIAKIMEDESKWNTYPTSDEVESLMVEEPQLVLGLAKMLSR